MKFKVITEKVQPDTEVLEARLISKEGAGSLHLQVRATTGKDKDWWYVLQILPNGKLYRNAYISGALGLSLTNEGRIEE